ncbi:hypothetical protein [Rhizobium grahamii]|uniref:hypothetical protein n=1 Tax=Rhizobium grahamii TaxID=1120045 RepID=UPI00159EEB24|nr:hypothetical protein [Rhizobium grahamii]
MDEFLVWLIVGATDEELRGVVDAGLKGSGLAAALCELAARNDLAWTLFDRMNSARAVHAADFEPLPNNGGIIGFKNTDSETLKKESREFASLAMGLGCDFCLAKGVTVADLYPSNVNRHQNDFDIATRSQQDFLKLVSLMIERDYTPRVLAVRLTGQNTLEGALSIVQIDQQKRRTLWCDIWVAVQPLSGGRTRTLPSSFWSKVEQLETGGVGPSIPDRLVLLINEVEERGALKLRDLLDFAFLSAEGRRMTDDADLNRGIEKLITNAASELLSFVKSNTPIVDRLASISMLRNSAPRYPLDVSNVGKQGKPPADTLVRFVAVSSGRGDLAVNEYANRTILRTPFGTFASEQSDKEVRERLFGG